MDLMEVLGQVRELLQKKGRITYRLLQAQFHLDNEALEALREELIEAEQIAVDEDDKVLVWVGNSSPESRVHSLESTRKEQASIVQTLDPRRQTLDSSAERRQLTVMFCDLVGSTALSEQLDPEEYREVVSLYQETCTAVIRRYAGHIAQHLGDGVLVYFGYPVAHEDDAQRAVRTGVEILAALALLNARLPSTIKARLPHFVQARIGIHTGVVVIGEIGSSEKREVLALGETPNIAARIQGTANPDEVMISATTYRLVEGLFGCEDRGQPTLKGISTPLSLYRVVRDNVAQSRFEAAVSKGLTPLVGREEELGLLRRGWEQAKASEGRVVLLSGEPGIGKSRLVQTLKEQVMAEGATCIEFRCSAYHQNSAFYPIIEHLQRLLQFEREDSPQAKLTKLQQALVAHRFPQADTLPLLATLLSLPQPEGMPPLTLSPQKQKQKIQEALVAWLVEEADKTAIYCVWEDLHWADPSTLDLLTLYLEQIPTTRTFTMLTCRPEFTPPWSPRSYLTQLTLSRLGRPHVEAMVEKVAGEKALPSEVLQQIVAKTDGVPLFVEELTKAVLESELYAGARYASPLPPLTIPPTLHDALMARLDRLAPIREIAQLGATLGREFSYELLHAVSPLDEETLQQGLRQLVEAELIYQRGLPPQATYLFKHALVQDAAYQSLLKSKRQQLHQQIAQMLEQRFKETVETHPELLAHHYTEAGLIEQALPYWQKAGQSAIERSANVEAIGHLTKGLAVLHTLPETPERARYELPLQLALGIALQAVRGMTSLEAEQALTRARDLGRQGGEPHQLFSALECLRLYYVVRGEHHASHQHAEQLLSLARREQDEALLSQAHFGLGVSFLHLGELPSAREQFDRSFVLYAPRWHPSLVALSGYDAGVAGLGYTTWVLWLLGYPEQAVGASRKALALAHELAHPYTLAGAQFYMGCFHMLRRESQAALGCAERTIALSIEQGFPVWGTWGAITRGRVLVEQGQGEDGAAELHKGLATWRTMGARMLQPYFLALLAETYGEMGQPAKGLRVLGEALAAVDKTGERMYEAEIYRLKGQLTLQPQVNSHESKVEEAQACFLKASEIAQHQQAKSLELRAATSLARLWQRQGKTADARQMLSEIYSWFTEGFDTKDLQEAKTLLEELQ